MFEFQFRLPDRDAMHLEIADAGQHGPAMHGREFDSAGTDLSKQRREPAWRDAVLRVFERRRSYAGRTLQRWACAFEASLRRRQPLASPA